MTTTNKKIKLHSDLTHTPDPGFERSYLGVIFVVFLERPFYDVDLVYYDGMV